LSERYLTLEESRKLLHVCDSTMRKIVKSGELVAHKFGGQYRIHPGDLRAYIDSTRVAG
jgi:excisionase family DNA binding protein